MKKIAFLIMNMDNKGGTERVTSMIANTLSDKYQTFIFSCQKGENPYFHVDKHVIVKSLHGEQTKNTILRKVKVFRELHSKIEKYDVDVVVAVDVALYLYLYPLQLTKQCKCIAWEHFNYYISPNKMVKFGRKLAAKHADCLIVLGKNDVNNYKQNLPRIKNIKYIYNPVAVSTLGQADIDSKRVMAAGRLEDQKGFDLLIDAWSKIEKDCPEWHLDIFGEGSKREELEQQIIDLGLNNVFIKGYANNIAEEFKKSSVFALSSRYEGFVLVLIEAQANGLPCVSFNCKEGPAEIITDNKNGFLVENGNVSEFANKLKQVLIDDQLRASFARHAKDNLTRFDILSIKSEWEKVIENL